MDAHAIALLMVRHWRATYEYAVICLASTSSSAEMAAAAAFRRVLGRVGDGALRPQLLTAVREFVRGWAADDGISAVLPELRKTIGGRGLRAARPVTSERRQLAERAFRALPGASQCLLWHTEVEAEPISVPAGLLGVDTARAAAALEQAREQFRTGCVRAHRELAPTSECRFYNRLLDVPIRRGGALLPDVREHLSACRYCRHAAEQLSHFEGGLEALLAETVLGWGAHRYLDSRPGRGGAEQTATARPRPGGRHRPEPVGLLDGPRRHAKAVLVGAGLTSLALLATVLVAKGWSDDGTPGPTATWGAVSNNTVLPSPAEVSQSAGSPSAASMGNSPVEVGHGRLRNADTGLCLDVPDGRLADGARAVLAQCSSAGSQQWSYQDDGVLRSAADPTLCLDADPEKKSVVVADCLVHSGEVRYDLTVRGELLLRRGKGLLVALGAGHDAVVAERDGSAEQRWELEGAGAGGIGGQAQRGAPSDGSEAPPGGGEGGSGDTAAPRVAPSPGAGGRPGNGPEGGSGGGFGDAPVQPPGEQGGSSGRYETRVAQVEGPDSGSADPVEGAGSAVGGAVSAVGGAVEGAGAAVGGVLDGAGSVVGVAGDGVSAVAQRGAPVTAPVTTTLGTVLP